MCFEGPDATLFNEIALSCQFHTDFTASAVCHPVSPLTKQKKHDNDVRANEAEQSAAAVLARQAVQDHLKALLGTNEVKNARLRVQRRVGGVTIVNSKELSDFAGLTFKIGTQTLRILQDEIGLIALERLCQKVDVLDPRGHRVGSHLCCGCSLHAFCRRCRALGGRPISPQGNTLPPLA